MYLRFLSTFLILLSLGNCRPKDRPDENFVIQETLSGLKVQSPKIVLQRKLNLDEDESLEIVYIIRNGIEEHLAVFKSMDEDRWELKWKKSFSLMNIGPFHHSLTDNKWVPVQEDKESSGFIIKKILASELPGDSFNSLFLEVLVEEPGMGIFSVPMGYRKGQKIMDGLSVLMDHPSLKTTKRTDFEYNPKDKSIITFPKDRNLGIEFVFNGFEMIPNLSSQPIPAIIKIDKKGKVYRIEFKNRGGFNTTTYITLSTPEGGIVRPISESDLRVYKKGDSVFSKFQEKYIPATYPMIEATKQSWGTNVRYAFEFEYEGEANYLLYRVSYRYNMSVETIPNSFSVVPTEVDQQGFLAYRLNLPGE